MKQKRQLTGAALCAKELKAELTAAFPRVKFSVKSDNFSMGDSVEVSYNFGPTEDELAPFLAGRQHGHFNGMEDIYEYSHTDKASTKFLHASRSYKVATEKDSYSYTAFQVEVMKALCVLQGVEYKGGDTNLFSSDDWNNYNQASNTAYRLMRSISFTSDNIEFINLKRKEDISRINDFALWFDIEYKDLMPAAPVKAAAVPRTNWQQIPLDQWPDAQATVPPATDPESVQAIDYSERSFMLYGNTFPVKDRIKELGGKFNGFLTHPVSGAKVKGWILPLTSKSTVMQALGL